MGTFLDWILEIIVNFRVGSFFDRDFTFMLIYLRDYLLALCIYSLTLIVKILFTHSNLFFPSFSRRFSFHR